MRKKLKKPDRGTWKIRFTDGTVGICLGTHEGATEIAELKKDLYGGDYIIEGGEKCERA